MTSASGQGPNAPLEHPTLRRPKIPTKPRIPRSRSSTNEQRYKNLMKEAYFTVRGPQLTQNEAINMS